MLLIMGSQAGYQIYGMRKCNAFRLKTPVVLNHGLFKYQIPPRLYPDVRQTIKTAKSRI